jgi:hypothetical protein
MKRRAFLPAWAPVPAGLPAIFVLSAFSLVGCPIYDHEDEGCASTRDCAPGYSCDRNTGECVAPGDDGGCARPSDCGSNETCDRNGECRLGDCSFADIGCVDGFECQNAGGSWRCVPEGSGVGGSGGQGSGVDNAAGTSAAGAPSDRGGAGGAPGSAGQGGEGPVCGGDLGGCGPGDGSGGAPPGGAPSGGQGGAP